MGHRVLFKNVQAPDMSGVSRALANSTRALNAGFNSAGNLLDKYNQGQQEKEDLAVTTELAGLKTEEDFSAYLQSGALSGRNISSKLQEDILGFRDSILNQNKARANTSLLGAQERGVNARTNLTGVQEDNAKIRGEGAAADIINRQVLADRNTNIYNDNTAKRDARRELTGGFLNAVDEARNLTSSNPTPNIKKNIAAKPKLTIQPDDREILARTLQAEAGGEGLQGMLAAGAVIRNRATLGGYGDGISGVIMKPGQFSAWNSVTGYAKGEGGLDMENINVSSEALEAADKILSGDYKDETKGATHYYNPNEANPVWGENAGGNWQAIGNHVFGFGDGNPGGNVEQTPQQIQARTDTSKEPGQANTFSPQDKAPKTLTASETLRKQIIDSGQFTPSEATSFLNQITDARVGAEAEAEAQQRSAIKEFNASNILNAAQNPNVLNQEDVVQQVLDASRGLSAVDQLSAIRGANNASTLLSNIVNPETPETQVDPAITDSITGFIQVEDNNLASSPVGVLQDLASDYAKGDPTELLITKLNLGRDGETRNLPKTRADLRKLITKISVSEKVSPSVVAAAMERNFQFDPLGFNTVSRRFNENNIKNTIQAGLDPIAVRNFNEQKTISERKVKDVKKMRSDLVKLRKNAVKFKGRIPPSLSLEIAQLQREILDFTNTDITNTLLN